MKRVLFIAYLFPPRGGGGVQRSAKFVKYLPEFGWLPTVICGPAPRHRQRDPTLALNWPAGVRVQEVQGLELPAWLPWSVRRAFVRWLLIVDGQLGWWRPAVKQSLRELQDNDFSAVFSTSAPYTDHLVARSLCGQIELPWIADFRDPWLDNFSLTFATGWHRKVCHNIQESIVRTSSKVTVVSEPMKDQLLKRHSAANANKIEVLPNGFDSSDFEGIEPRNDDRGKFTITYTGTLFGAKSVRPFLKALRRLLDDQLLSAASLKLRLVGTHGKEAETLVHEWRLEEVVEIVGYVSHGEAISFQLGSDALLLVIGAVPGSEVVITGKLYEYLASGRPILAIAPSGAASELLRRAEAGVTVHPADMDGIAEALMKMFNSWQSKELGISPNEEIVSQFDRRRQAERLAQLLDEVSG